MILRRFRSTVAVALAVLPATGCVLNFDASTLGVRATLSEPAGSGSQGEEFVVSKKAVFLFFGILRVGTPSLEEALAGQLVDGQEIQNVSIKVRSRFSDLLIMALTAGLVTPRSVTFSGTVAGSAGGDAGASPPSGSN